MTKPDFTKPSPIDDVTAAFPGRIIGTLLPLWADIPAEFKSRSNEFAQFAHEWFFDGIEGIAFNPDIDTQTAGRHLQACLCSYEPKHQHKIAGVAYMMSLWGARKATAEELANQS
jgi:hypothetical protein